MLGGLAGALLSQSPAGAAGETYTASQNISDTFARRVANGLGRADMGGAYTIASPSSIYSVTAGHARILRLPSGHSALATLRSVAEADERIQFALSFPSLPRSGDYYVGAELRRQSLGSAYRAKLHVTSSGTMILGISRVSGRTETTLVRSLGVRGRVTAGAKIILSAQTVGSAPVTVQVRAWLAGSSAPSWQLTATDNSAVQLAARGAAGLWAYTGSTANAMTVDVSRATGWKLTHGKHGTSASPTPTTSTSSSTTSAPSPTTTAPTTSTTSTTTTPTTPAATTTSQSATTTPAPAPSTTSAGSAVPGDTSYAIPDGALFVSPSSGSDSGSGTIGSPFRTVAHAVSVAPSGAAIVLRAGSYHESVSVPSTKVITIQGYPGEAAWFDGSSVVSSWTQSGNAWVHSGWTAQFDSTAGYSSGMTGWVNPSYPMASHPDQAWIDGTALKQVGSLAEVTGGTFYVDYSTSQLYVGSDPSGHEVRASDVGIALDVQSPNSVLRGFGVRRYATSIPSMGTVKLRGTGDRIENVTVTDSAAEGLYVRASAISVNHVTTQYNGLLGISGNYADGLSITNTLAQYNNVEHFNNEPVAGGIKITRTRGITVKNTDVNYNQGNGLWFDESCYNFVIAGGTLIGNTHYGFDGELSDLGIVVDNVVKSNGYDGLRITDTDNVKIWNNTFGNNYRSVELYQDSRTYTAGAVGVDPRQPYPDPTMSWVTKNIQIENNLMAELGQFHVYVYDSSHTLSANDRNITVDGDLFTTPGTGQAEIGWYAGGSTVLTFKSTSDFTAYTGQGTHNTETSGATGPLSPDTVTSVGDPLPLPSDVAAAAGQPAGTRHIGAF